MKKRISCMTPTYRIMGDAAAAGVSRRRSPQERLQREGDLNSVKKLVVEMPLYP